MTSMRECDSSSRTHAWIAWGRGLFPWCLVLCLLCIPAPGSAIGFNDVRVSQAVNMMFIYVEGSFGALVFVCAGVFAILSAAVGQYRAALALLVVGIGGFILRSILSTFFNDITIRA